ncbi:hypothetical protein B0J12DRAFT_69262 [Macrophomina phaseolina]|uniref:Apple domain-containing protein n=1 Tax=Macrophomina phaseolina TaxID=35725 RepID=A0ABQ8GD45_9PEZI|nr:hypothetical protein B0J12DRAFT_69262 [Macrophomina phaseolina]
MMGATDGMSFGAQVSTIVLMYFSALVAALPAPSGATPSSSATGVAVPTGLVNACPTADGGYFTGQKGFHYRLHCNTDRLGGDLYAVYGQPDISACVSLCDAEPACVGSTWEFPTADVRTDGGICYLKSSLVPESVDHTVDVVVCEDCPGIQCPSSNGTTAWSGGKSFTLLCDKEQYGGNLGGIDNPIFGQTISSCLQACGANPDCAAVTFQGGTCYLKSANPVNIATANGYTAWVNLGGGATSSLVPRQASGTTATTPATATTPTTVTTATTATSTAGTTGFQCPANGNSVIRTPNEAQFQLICGRSSGANPIGTAPGVNYQDCANQCAVISQCQSVSFTSGTCSFRDTATLDLTGGDSLTRLATAPSPASCSADDRKVFVAGGYSFQIRCASAGGGNYPPRLSLPLVNKVFRNNSLHHPFDRS